MSEDTRNDISKSMTLKGANAALENLMAGYVKYQGERIAHTYLTDISLLSARIAEAVRVKSLFGSTWNIAALELDNGDLYGRWYRGVHAVTVNPASGEQHGRYDARFYAEGAAPLVIAYGETPELALRALFADSAFVQEMAGLNA